MDELSQLDGLEESDILDALGAESNDNSNEEITLQDIDEPTDIIEAEETRVDSDLKNEVHKTTLSGSSLEEISSLLSQLLNNKTIEITIKIKD